MKHLFGLFYTLGLVLFFSCNEHINADDIRNKTVVKDSAVIPIDSNTVYFPENNHNSDTENQLNKFRNAWYSKMLFALHEPTLFNSRDTSETFRFTWLRTFHNPMSIRVTKIRDQCVLTVKITAGTAGYGAEKVIKDTSFFITRNEWNKIVSKVSKINFWKLESFIGDGGKDGSEWILEGRNKNEYHFVSRWSPNSIRFNEFKECCEYFIQLSNINLTEDEIY